MKHLPPLLASALTVVLGGCTSAPLRVEKDAEQVSAILGVPQSELVFLTEGDVALAEEFEDFFKPTDSAVIGMTEDEFYWFHLDRTLEHDVKRIAAADITILANDLGCLQVKTEDELYLVRLRGWNRYRGDGKRTLQFVSHLLEANSDLFFADAEIVYKKVFNGFRDNNREVQHDSLADPDYETPDRFAHKYPQDSNGNPIRY